MNKRKLTTTTKEETKKLKVTSTCFICEEDSSPLPCGHSVCSTCLLRHCRVKMESRYTNINCPGLRCPHILDLLTVKASFNLSNVFGDQWNSQQEKLSEISLSQDPSFLFCPTPDCGYCGFTTQSEGCVECLRCKGSFCVSCRERSHEGRGCHEVKDRESMEYKKGNTKECPKCKTSIEKNGGCVHITCGNCQTQFCWNCQGLWKTREEILRGLEENLRTSRESLTRAEAETSTALTLLDPSRVNLLLQRQNELQRHIQNIKQRIQKMTSPPPTPFQRQAMAALDMANRRQRGDPSVPEIMRSSTEAFRAYLSAIQNMKKALTEGTYQNADLVRILSTVSTPRQQYLLSNFVPVHLELRRNERGTAESARIEMKGNLMVPTPLPEIYR
ncbi:ubiquitin-protein ligase [Planoprotostelium fungivorum]|uniref:RBR-type E3 ubiquitin transferase n=1 Tax=Planoprotostelium fungivorum TaxID=1890364 RepID=A0A2P6ND27_9EUKA|nr:ubiquitin-protein ligase [Planoprotostelium fungivorum]